MNDPLDDPSSASAVPFKRCTKCGKVYPATAVYFNRNARYKDGFALCCKECKKAYYRADAEHIKARVRQYKKDHKEEVDRYNMLYRSTHKEEKRKYDLQYYKTHQEEYRLSSHRYYKTETGHIVSLTSGHLCRARKRNVGGNYKAADIEAKLKAQKHRCYYAACGHARFKKVKGNYVFHIDHIVPLSREGSSNGPDNLVLTCPSCNLRKGNHLPSEWPEGGRLL